MLKRVLWAVVVIVVGVGAWLASYPLGLWNTSYEEVTRRYETPASKYVELSGLRVHYRDEGSGPVILLLHANLGNLRMWDGWVPELAKRYRVLRPDMLSHGLTGPIAGFHPEKEYGDRLVALIDEFTRAMKVERMVLVATSFSGIGAYRYAALHPEKVTALVLINSGGLPRTAETNPNRPRGPLFTRWQRQYYTPKSWLENSLGNLIGSNSTLSPKMVQQYYDFVNVRGRAQEGAAAVANYRFGDVEGWLARVQAPVLLMWGGDENLLDLGQARTFERWLKNTRRELIIYPGVGHILPIEAPDRSRQDFERFLASLPY